MCVSISSFSGRPSYALTLQAINKKNKTNKIVNAGIVGFTIGIVFYSAIKNGFEFFTFFPLILAYVIIRNSTNKKILQKKYKKN